MMQRPRVVLHLGPHKTATTYLQKILQMNQPKLEQAGIDYVPLRELRTSLTPMLAAPRRADRPDISSVLERWMCGKTLVLFEENFIGLLAPPRNGSLYPAARARLTVLAAMLRGFEVETHITMRSMVDYLPSRYSEYLRHYPFLSFDDYYAGVDLNRVSWQHLVRDIHEVFGRPVHVNLFNQVVEQPAHYLRKLVNSGIAFDLGIDAEAPAIRRSGISSEAHHILSETARLMSGEATKLVFRALQQVKGGSRTPYRPLSKSLEDTLARSYSQDIKALSDSSKARVVQLEASSDITAQTPSGSLVRGDVRGGS